MKFKLGAGWCAQVYVEKFTRNFINYDIPDTFMKVNGKWVWIVSRKYGVLTLGYCELPLEERKNVLNFIIQSAIAFYKWSYTWKCNHNASKNLVDDVNKFIERFYKDTFGDSYREALNALGYIPLKTA